MPFFEGTFASLADAETSLVQLHEAEDAQQFRTSFNSFVKHARSVTFALQKEGKHIEGFDDWYQKKRENMRKDELLKFFHDARNRIDKKGEQILEIHDPDAPIDSGFSTTKRVEGGTIFESDQYGMRQRTHILPQPKITIRNPPRTHIDAEIENVAPIHLCKLVVRYLEQLIRDAEEWRSSFRPPLVPKP